jgi:hypothetical protein
MTRKSFILHIDSLGILNELTDEQAGQLFKLIYEYHNPNKPKQTQITQLVNLAFYPFKSQFERDNQTYNNVCERNKNNGLLGGRPKNKNPNKPKKADSDNKNKNKNDNKNDNKSVINKINIRPFVFISQSELDKLNSEFSEYEVNWMLDKLNDYKASKGVQYKSDYHAINMWVKDAFRKAKVDFIKDNNTSEVRIATAMKSIENINWDDYKLL